MQFTIEQYDEAIQSLQEARAQLEMDGGACAICGGEHYAFECGRNPLVAMNYCRMIAEQSDELHTTLHYLAGFDTRMGEQVGPAIVILPDNEAAS